MHRSTIENWHVRIFLIAISIVFGAAVCIGYPIWGLLTEGPFSWHISQPGTWQGGVEVLLLAGAMVAVSWWVDSQRLRLFLLLGLAELYLRRHYVDLPIIVDLLYFELLVGIGGLVARWFGLPPAHTAFEYLKLLVAGIVLWSSGAWLLSAFGIGSVHALRWYTIALALPVLVARHPPLSAFVWTSSCKLTRQQRSGVVIIVAWLLCLVARTNVVSGYDALWYGLRGEYVLVAAGSVFSSLGLVAPVHYYPKLYELLLIPVSALGDTSVIVGVSILILAAFALTCAELLNDFRIRTGERLLLTALCITVPAIANSALLPKPDLFSAWLLLLACITAVRFARDGHLGDGCWTVLLCGLACASKLTAPPYVVALLLASVSTWVWRKRPRAAVQKSEMRFAVFMLAASVVVIALVTYRTFAMTGTLLVGPQQVVELLAKLGFTLKPPVGLLTAGPPLDWRSVPMVLFDQLFRPQTLTHMVISWIGNVWLYLLAIALVAHWTQRNTLPNDVPWIWWSVPVVGFVLLTTFSTPTRGSDGEYFVLPVALAILLSAYLAMRQVRERSLRVLLAVVLPVFILFHVAYGFVSASWATGTRALDLDFSLSVRDAKRQRQAIFEFRGISRIAEYLQKIPHAARAVGYVPEEVGFRLQATFEHLIYYRYWYPAPLEDADTFLRYLLDHRIDYVILPKPAAAVGHERIEPAVAEAARQLDTTQNVRLIDDLGFVLYDLSAVHASKRVQPSP
ncbi:MAG: hypothetical protein ABIW82_06525 [Dokdonella sp.]